MPPKNSQSTEQYTIIDPVPPPSDIIESDPSVGIKESEVTDTDSVLFASLNAAERSGDLSRVVHEVQKLRNSSSPPSTAVYNAALQALYAIRTPGEPIFQILETYNNMLAQSITPNYRTYAILILALTDRDNETHKAILHIQGRMRRRTATGTLGGNAQATDEQRIVRLRSENNFGSALTLFQAASLIPRTKPHIALYTNLLRSCANHANIDAAIHVFAHLEKRTDLTPSPLVYGHLISVYTNAGDLQGAEEVFEEFKKASAKQAEESKTLARPASERWGQISVWNDIIVAYFRCGQPASALAILEQMMDSAAGEEFGVADVPPPSSATFSAVISGFCQSGDIASAISWFDKLLQQEQSSVHPHEPTVTPTKPDQHAWNTMLDALAVAGQVKDLNRFFEIATQTGVEIRIADRIVTLRANFFYVESLSITEAAEGVELLDFVVKHILEDEKFCKWPAAENGGPRAICEIITKHYVRFGQPEKALKLAEMCIPTLKALLTTGEASGNLDNDSIQFRMKGLRNLAKTLSSLFFKDTPSSLSLSQVLRIGHLCIDVGVAPSASYSLPYLNAYMSERGNEPAVVPLGPEWELLLWAAFASDSSSAPSADASEQAPIPADASEQAPNSADASEQVPIPADVGNNTVETLLGDMSHHQADLGAIPKQARRKVAEYLSSKYSISGAKEFLQNLGAGYIEAFGPIEEDSRVRISASDIPPLASPPQAAPTQHVHVDLHHSSFVDEYYSKRYDMTPMIGYNRFEAGMRTGVYPSPEVLGRLINGVGRLGYVDKVRKLYDAAQLVLATLERDKHWQSVGWFQVEDQMIIALAHAGDTDAAHIHRNRILAEGGTPSADAYGALIQKVRDTTDDTANAMTLFQEAATRGVRPNIYLYNTMISKLAKARKADHALELFQEMKTRGVRPTSVTYGAVIAACCRVGDVQSAELLFKEMATQPNFRPRVPPYNTMIQLFTHTKPDRERALYYYKALQKVGVQPTAHTYKVCDHEN